MRDRLTIGAAVAATALAVSGAASAQDAPEWLGGELKKPLSETRIGITVLYPGSNAYQAKYAETAESLYRGAWPRRDRDGPAG